MLQLSSNIKEGPFYYNIQTPAGDTGHGTEVETDRNYEEVEQIVEAPFTMENNVAYSTTTIHTHN